MLTVDGLLDEVGLTLSAGSAAGAARVRWVHCSELLDPTPWLQGGEVLLTTGIQLTDPERQRAYVQRLADHRIAAVGFGSGFLYEELPQALVDAAEALSLPLFEVPYELPFIAICERAFGHLVSDGYAALRRSTEIQQQLERLVVDERGMDAVTAVVAEAIGGTAVVLNPRGATIATAGPHTAQPPPSEIDALRDAITGAPGAERLTIDRFEPRGPAGADSPEPVELLGGRALALPVMARGRATAWLAGIGGAGALGDFERLILQQSVTVVALELMRLRIARDTERRLAGDVFAEALTGRLEPDELATRLRPFGFGAELAVLVFAAADPVAAEPLLAAALAQADVPALVAVRGPLACAVIDAAGAEPVVLARRLRTDLAGELGDVRAAVSRRLPVAALRRAFHEARCALEAVRFANGSAPEVASHRDLGSFELLLSLQDDDALRSYCDGVLAAIENGDPDYAHELLRSLDAFLAHTGHWERAAAELDCHRHTLRYRIRRVEELTGRDLSSQRDRIEFWLALRGRELAR
jgi:purine catabolism regulator